MPRIRFALAALFFGLTSGGAAVASDVIVFAASSLKTALDAVAADWQAETGNRVVISYGGSSTLARQIAQGAPADLFFPAAVTWMDFLQAEGLIPAESRIDLLGNTLVLVAHGEAAPVVLDKGLDLAAMLDGGKLSMAMVDSVPAGQYGKEALVSLGLWASVEASVVQSENVRAALALVARGEAPYGVVYGSDAVADDSVSVAGVFPADSHRKIVYAAALTASATSPVAQEFLAYLSEDAADTIFARNGFSPLN